MTDLIKRLRMGTQVPEFELRQEAADEIERLRAVVDRVAHLPLGHICDARWIALAALEDEYTIKIKGIPSKLEPPEDE